MTRFQPVGAKYLDPRLLLDQLINGPANIGTKDEIVKPLARRHERDTARSLLRKGGGRDARPVRPEGLLQTFGEEVVLLLALLRDQRLSGPSERHVIAGASRTDKSHKQVSTGHALSVTVSTAGRPRWRTWPESTG